MRQPGSPLKIAILIPTHEKADALFTYDLASLGIFTASVMPEDCLLGIEMAVGTYIHKARTSLLQKAIKDGATHVLWLDSDMRFPKDALIRLLQRQVPIVGINYSKRRTPPEFVAIKSIPRGDEPGRTLYTGPKSTGLEEVDVLGFGCVLMETDSFVNLPDPKTDPWFWFDKTEEGHHVGEDAYFCLRMLKEHLGHRIFVDHDLSNQCAHIGPWEFRTGHAAALQDMMEEANEEEPSEEEE